MKNIIGLIAIALFSFSSFTLQAQSSLKKANKQYELKAFNAAINSYQKVLLKDPNNGEALSKLADCYRHLNQITDAVQTYERAFQQRGYDPIHILHYAKCLQALGDYTKAKEWFLNYGEAYPLYGQHFAKSCDFALSMKEVPALYTVQNEFANSEASDFGPAFFGNKIVFASARTDIARQNVDVGSSWTGNAYNQLFVSGVDDKGFILRPTFLRNDYKNGFNEGPVSYSANGEWVAFTKNNFADGTRQIPSSGLEMSIYIAKVNANGDWTDAQAFPYNGSAYSTGYPSLSADGSVLYFASDRPDGFGGFDIFVSTKVGETWSAPENLGAIVNSSGNEISPFYDGLNLFFSSDWHQGYGGFDIFRAQTVGVDWKKVYHLGNDINSSYDDYGLVFSGESNVGYFTSNRMGGKGKEDIYKVSKATENFIVSVIGANGKSIPYAVLDFAACGETAFKTNEDGKYSFQALAGLNCDVLVSKAGYESVVVTIKSEGSSINNKVFEVVLNKEAEKYIGRVVDATDNTAVSEVYIKATNQGTSKVANVVSNENGEYALALDPNASYIIKYSKASFVDTNKTLKTGDGKDRTILGTIPLTSSTTVLSGGDNTDIITEPSNTTGTSTDSGSTSTNTNTTTYSDEPKAGYAVQIAAVAKGTKNFSKYTKLQTIGNVYGREEGKYTKVRVGVFASKSEASQARKAIIQKGYKSAFVVSDVADSPILDLSNLSTSNNGGTSTSTSSSSTSSTVSKYKVRLASYRDASNFKASKVNSFGKVEQKISGSWTIILLSGYPSLAEAKIAKSKAIGAGFKGAHIVADENGKLKRIN